MSNRNLPSWEADRIPNEFGFGWSEIFRSVFEGFDIPNRNSVIVVANHRMVEWVYREFKEWLMTETKKIMPIGMLTIIGKAPELYVNSLLISHHNQRFEYEWWPTKANLFIVTPDNWLYMRGRQISQVYYHSEDYVSREFCLSGEVKSRMGKTALEKKKPRRMIQT